MTFTNHASLQINPRNLPHTNEHNPEDLTVAAYVSLFLGTLFLAGNRSKQKETH